MKKLVVFLVAVVSILTALIPVSVGAASGDEVWKVFEGGGGLAYVNLTINTSNLRTSQFEIVNNDTRTLYFFIFDPRTRTIINNFYVAIPANSSVIQYWVVNYQRNNDVDSYPIKMPPNTTFSFGTGAPWENTPPITGY